MILLFSSSSSVDNSLTEQLTHFIMANSKLLLKVAFAVVIFAAMVFASEELSINVENLASQEERDKLSKLPIRTKSSNLPMFFFRSDYSEAYSQ